MIHQVSIPLYMKSPLSIKNIIQCNDDIVQEKKTAETDFYDAETVFTNAEGKNISLYI